MATPLAPIVHGPLLPSSTHVLVSGALSGATVTVLANGGDAGVALAAGNGNVLVELHRTLAVGEKVTAVQMVGSATSPASSQPVTVIPVPASLPAPLFASPVTECMDSVLLAGLVPGATVEVKTGATALASFQTSGTAAWATLGPALLEDGHVLTAIQRLDGLVSPIGSSPPLAAIDAREQPPPPVVKQPVTACETAVLVSSLIPAAVLELAQDNWSATATNVATAYWATGTPPFEEGRLRAKQRLPRCGGESQLVDVPVGPPVTPPAPVLQPFCPAAKRVVVSGLKAGGVLTLWSRRWDDTVETEIGSVGIGSSVQQVDLPAVVGGTGPHMSIVARQTLCGLTSPPGSANEFARPGSGALPAPEPRIVAPLLACMRAVPGEKFYNGVLVHAWSSRTGVPLSDVIVVTSPTARIPTWFPLTPGDEVEIRQAGCDAPPRSPAVRVDDLPAALPAPTIQKPVRPLDQTVKVHGCLPGSRVHLLVEGQERAATDQTWTGEAVLQLQKPLQERQRLWAVQTMCTRSSPREGPPVFVAKGTLGVEVSPASAPGGKAASFTVTARDTETGVKVGGLPVVIGGATVGYTGVAFGWTPPSSGAAVTGVVKGGAVYSDASFTITLRQAVPVTLNLFPGPVVWPGKAWQSDVEWTLTPRWPGSAPVTLNANVGTVMVPPPPGTVNHVAVSVSLKAHLQGEIEGYDWPPEIIDIGGYLADIALTKPSHALSARFWYGAFDVPETDDDGNVTGWTLKLAAGVQLFSIT
jgi:hypothetical protein